MTRPERITHKAIEWIKLATEELVVASALAQSAARHSRAVAFHSQQCAEMAIKAWLIHNDVDFPFTHNIENLLNLCAPADWATKLDGAKSLTRFATTNRYADAEFQATFEEAVNALALAREVLDRVREALENDGIVLK